MIEVWARRTNTREAAALVERLRAEGRDARENNSRWFDPAQLDPDAVLVYHDGEDMRIPEAYAALGIPCEIIPGFEGETVHEASGDPPLVDEDQAGSHRVERAGSWYKLIGPDGQQIGKSQRSEEDAWALLDESG